MVRRYEVRPHAPTSFRIDYARELNPAQLDAVEHYDGPCLCIAGAGSGKTRTLVYRVSRMLESGIAPESILLLTFTRKAAHEMLSRAGALGGASAMRVAGGTFHSFAARVLREFAGNLGYRPDFSILDEGDSGDILGMIRAEMGLNQKKNRFPRKETLRKILSKSVNCGLSIEHVVERDFDHFFEHLDEMLKLFVQYDDYKKKHQMMDYDDLLIEMQTLLEQHRGVREILADRLRYLMVDEYQDTNRLQARITFLLGCAHRNVLVVGDDAQSIYSFRGADFRNIHEFPALFEGCRIVRLEENYRSVNSILDASNALMEKAQVRFEKRLFSNRGAGEKPALVPCRDESEQSCFIAQRILELREEGYRLSEIAVLFRSSFHAYGLEIELKKRGIPYVKWGGFKFLEAAHIKDILAFFRVLQNPRDFISWSRVLAMLEGIGPKSVARFYEAMQKLETPFELEKLEASDRQKTGLVRLGLMLRRADKVRDDIAALYALVTDFYLPILKARYDDHPKRVRDLDQLSLQCSRFPTLSEMLAEFALEPPSASIDDMLATDNDDEDRLVLSTIHSAKGLEWRAVFLIWAVEGRFPSFNALESAEAVEEERRLFYVAMTRARDLLTIAYPVYGYDRVSGMILSRPSRFLSDIPEAAFERWELHS